jgi:arylsulfatase A-like enzyme
MLSLSKHGVGFVSNLLGDTRAMASNLTARTNGGTRILLPALLLALGFAVGAGRAAAGGPDVHVAPAAPDLAVAGRFGRLLETLPVAHAASTGPRRISRPVRIERFQPAHVQLAARSASTTDTATTIWLFAGAPQLQTSFTYRCPISDGALLRSWAFAASDAAAPYLVTLRGPTGSHRLEIPRVGQRFLLYEAPLGGDPCGAADSFTLTVDAAGLPTALVMSPPMIVEAAERTAPPVILISLDTQRLDYWDGSSSRPASLQAFLRDALQYTHAYTSFPTTAQSHSVLFSGRFFSDVTKLPLDPQISFATSLHEAGYVTMGFVAGGYMRAGFGFGRRAPGFALGFDVYVEGMQLDDQSKDREARRHPTILASEAALQTYTLAPSLERSLAWLTEHATEPVFHFIHGYDVHEYRSVAREYWDAAVAARIGAGLDRATLEDCIEKVGMEMDASLVAHHRFEDAEAFRTRPLGALEACHRLLASAMYDARVRSVEAALGRYFDALRALGVYDRALIIVTSDHGESLLDESAPGDPHPYWGHNRLLANNLRVPLWIKQPGAAGNGGAVDDVVGLVDIRATVADVLGLAAPPGSGRSLLRSGAANERLIRFEEWRGGHGVVLPDGELCTWSHEQPDLLSVYARGAWQEPDAEQRQRCAAARAGSPPAPPQKAQPIPPELVDELRALGYVE